MIGLREHTLAIVGFFLMAAIAVGGKASGAALVIWTVGVIAYVAHCRQSFRAILGDMSKLSAPEATLLVLAGYAALSAFWARNPQLAIAAGATLAGVTIVGRILRSGLNQLTEEASTLVAGWLTIGLVVGSLILVFEFWTNFAILRWMLAAIPEFRPISNSMLVEKNSRWILTNISIGNWSVAAVSMAMWPALLTIASIAISRARIFLSIGMFALVCVIASVSEHQTSKIGILVSLVTFGVATIAPAVSRRFLMGMCLFLIVMIVPLSYSTDRMLHLSDASWAQRSLKERFRIWGSVSEHYTAKPILGIGANNTTNVETSHPVPINGTSPIIKHHPHNMILQIWLELGAVGGVLLLIAGYQVCQVANRLPPKVIPYVFATGVMITIEAIATWNVWSTWFLSALAITIAFLFLGVRMMQDSEKPTFLAFAEIWLPQSFKAWWPGRAMS